MRSFHRRTINAIYGLQINIYSKTNKKKKFGKIKSYLLYSIDSWLNDCGVPIVNEVSPMQ